MSAKLEVTGGANTTKTFKARVTSTNTEAVWKERALEKRWFVNLYTGNSPIDGAGDTELMVDFLGNNDASSVGRLEATSGSGSNFVVTVEMVGVEGRAHGSATNADALAAADYGRGVQGATGGKLSIVASGGVPGIAVVGGDKRDLWLTWNLIGQIG